MSTETERFVDFKNSFSYGSRCDLNFKFLKALSAGDAARFFQELLWKIGDSLDDGDVERLIAHVQEWQTAAYDSAVPRYTYDDGPFTPLPQPVSQSRLALLSSSGHFVVGHDPQPFGVKNMTQEEAVRRMVSFLRHTPELSEIPLSTPPGKLRVRHGGYDVRGAQADPNVTLPLYRLASLVAEGLIGDLVDPAYAFVGAAAQRPLLREKGPQWVRRIQDQGTDGVILVPV
ncbi:MAG TPA: glycine/sarcosine/betaine reductase selenoprotein B family protein [Candidatus Sulfomarinibacteraceae bacterium]|nr:glycine/sarcosine/betaine reductase selenoprotein B family protein [Candidatus Sulfomarinibacteraceae bacterium]